MSAAFGCVSGTPSRVAGGAANGIAEASTAAVSGRTEPTPDASGTAHRGATRHSSARPATPPRRARPPSVPRCSSCITPKKPMMAQNPPTNRAPGGTTNAPADTTATADTAVPGSHIVEPPCRVDTRTLRANAGTCLRHMQSTQPPASLPRRAHEISSPIRTGSRARRQPPVQLQLLGLTQGA